MPLSKFTKGKTFKPLRVFSDREVPMDIFARSLEDLRKGTSEIKVLVFYGVGGIGKSTLLKHLKRNLQSTLHQYPELAVAAVDLEAFEFDSPTDVIIALRNQIKVPCEVFDYALVRYWPLVGHSPLELKGKAFGEGSLVWDMLELAGGFGPIPIPAKLFARALTKVRQKLIGVSERYKEAFIEIDELEAPELRARLPYYLGLAIHDAAPIKRHVIFLDSYEAMLRVLGVKAVSEASEEWVREFICASKIGLFVVGSRECLKWKEVDPEWESTIKQYPLGQLLDTDADFFLRSVPIDDEQIRAAIISTSRGLPLYLDLCVNIYASQIERGQVLSADDFEMAADEVISRFLRHLSVEERELVKTLCAIPFFDIQIFRHLVGTLNIGYSVTRFKEFIELSFISNVEDESGFYRIDEPVRSYVGRGLPPILQTEIFNATIDHLARHTTGYSVRMQGRFFCALMASQEDQNVSWAVQEIESLLEICFYLIENGLWLTMYDAIQRVAGTLPIGRLANALRLIRAVCLRRVGKLETALAEISQVNMGEDYIGRFSILAAFHKGNIIRLLGNYADAAKVYRALGRKVSTTATDLHLQAPIRRQLADIYLLQGKFGKSLSLLTPIQDAVGLDTLQLSETKRIVAHIHRFNMNLKEAEDLYASAIAPLDGNKGLGLIGKLQTNLVETLCWEDPQRAIAIAQSAMETNLLLGAKIEIGKLKTALAIAHVLHDRKIDEADRLVDEARQILTQVGYMAGIVFAELATFMILAFCNDRQGVVKLESRMAKLISSLKVYSFLTLPIKLFLDKRTAIQNLARAHDWLDFAQTCTVYHGCLRRLHDKPG